MTKRQANTYRRRLLKLAKFLRVLPRERFYYGTWVGSSWKGAKDLSCGTTACALGWATTIPEFRRLGLRMKRVNDFGSFIATPACGRYHTEKYAALKVFGLTVYEATQLFLPSGSRLPVTASPTRVAKHIETFVKKWKPENKSLRT